MQIYGQRQMLYYIACQGLLYLMAVSTYYIILLDHPSGLWDEHSPRNSGVLEGLGLMGVTVYSIICRRQSRRRAWKTIALDQVRAVPNSVVSRQVGDERLGGISTRAAFLLSWVLTQELSFALWMLTRERESVRYTLIEKN
jgi:hypothetical protein